MSAQYIPSSRTIVRFLRYCLLSGSAGLLLGLGATSAIAQGKYGVTGIGVNFSATSISNNGFVTGNYFTGTAYRAFIWSKTQGAILLSPCPDSNSSSFGFGVNNAGQVVGDCSGDVFSTIFLWDPNSGSRQIYSHGCVSHNVTGISDSGLVSGSVAVNCDDPQVTHAFRWNGGLQQLSDLVGSSLNEGLAVNSAGYVAGDSGGRAVLWSPEGGAQNLGTLGGDSAATALNDSQQVVGYSFVTLSDTRAFIWDSTNGIQDIGMLPGASSCFANGINSRGVVTGACYLPGPGIDIAFVWDRTAGMRDLNHMIPIDSGWHLDQATAINNNGQIVGWGSQNDQPAAFVLTPASAPLIFIPGMMGSRLVDRSTGEELWPGGVLTDHTRLSVDPSAPPNPNIVATDAIDHMTVLSGPFAQTKFIYEQLLNMLTSRGNYKKYEVNNDPSRRTSAGCDLNQKSDDPNLNPNLFVFAYDWRKSNIENVAKLSDYVACIQQFYPDTKVDILTHSMGGILARRYVLDHPGKVDRMITIAAPWLGAPKGIYGLETGDMGLGAISDAVFIWRPTLKNLAIFSPSAHELLPSSSYYLLGGRPFAERGDFNRNGVPDEVYTYPQQVDLLNQRYPQTGPGSNGAIFHNYPGQDDWRNDDTGVEYHMFFSQQRRDTTIGQVIAQRLPVCHHTGEGPLICDDQDFFDTRTVNGDGTVPLRSARQFGGMPNEQGVPTEVRLSNAQFYQYPGNANFADGQIEHTALTQLNNVHDFLLFLLGKGPEPFSGDFARNQLPLKGSPIGPRADAVLARASNSKRRGHRDKTGTKLAHAGSGMPATVVVTANAVPQNPPLKNPSYFVTVTGTDLVSITDEAGNTNTPINDVFALRVPDVSYDLVGSNSVFITTPADKTYAFSFHVGNGPINLSILKGIDNITPSQAIRYRDVTLPAGANVTFRVTPFGIEDVLYDTNNDGTSEGTVTPTSTLIGGAAEDTTAPTITFTGTPQPTSVTVTIATQDGQSGVKNTYYSFDRVHYQLYSGPLSVNPAQVPTIYAFADDNAANRSGMMTYTVPPVAPGGPTLTALGPAQVWIGLKNSDDVGTKFDLLAEVFKNGTLIGSGQINNIAAGSSGFNNAKLNAINLALSGTPAFGSGSVLSFKLSVRITAAGGHRSGTARLWFNDSAANSLFTSTFTSGANTYYLRTSSLLETTAGSGPRSTVDVFVDRAVGGNPFKPFGTWTLTF